ncbi:MAG: aminotransferase class I/II-fold pyridoxal phosphate-dependent enzyme, partial [Gammaproteobacteria bacterium]|nr:aminotransferase class I/II-fold pyridoxal phosphate-dependent enzyme [Gammaproteobacteria bacterium]
MDHRNTSDPTESLFLRRDLGEPAAIPTSGLRRAEQLIRGGYITRYGEFGRDQSEVALLERDFADYLGCRYAVALNSGGSALFLAMLSCGVKQGDQVLLNAFTLAPVPGSIVHAGAIPVFVECDDRYLIDLDDLARKVDTGAQVLMLSHMRGHIADMDAVTDFCQQRRVTLIEDCAHTLGAKWDGTHSGRFGDLACYSFQSYKHINAGEGGMLVTDDPDLAAKAILYSGSYMMYGQNGAAPSEEVFARHQAAIPNLSLRMHEVTAALARPQIELLEERGRLWNASYRDLEARLGAIEHVTIPTRDPREEYVASSIQFSITGVPVERISQIVDHCVARGVGIKWFGRSEP